MSNDEKHDNCTMDKTLKRILTDKDFKYTNLAPNSTNIDALKQRADELADTIIELYGEQALELAHIYESDLDNDFAKLVTKSAAAKLRGE
ncbi:hypothetical protein M2281_001241 [Mesorhizobium soli]|uniref:hypothetical protein n=1 Tax=Pseudaminobacter soli (ex Li et al. 2025) TaxID=1295366 RepID=UPI0024762C2C|nr:hypothetical protein [Mesorhizobium soli]MDH6230669.1 hypothetical protein [Mesorhizobium soli]